MSRQDEQVKTATVATQPPAAQQTSEPPKQTSVLPSHYKHLVGSIPETNTDSFIQTGKAFAHTVNLPFTTIPFVPAATTFLKKFDKAANQDLGFTYKASTANQDNAQGGQDLLYKVDYIGFGVMSSKFNVQLAPIAAKIGVGKEIYKGFGCNASVLSSPLGAVHERLGIKATFTDCNGNSKSVSVAAEASYQKSDSFRPISTATYGYFFGNDASFRIKEKYIPLYNRFMSDVPSWEESKVALEHIAPAFPFIMQAEAISKGVKVAEAVLTSAASATKSMFESATTTVKSILPVSNSSSLPNATHPFAKHAPQTPAIDHQHYNPAYKVQVKPGDNLWDIAAREKGDPNQYKAIAEKNHIKTPNIISPTKEKKLIISGYQKSNEEKATYTIRAEDTLDIIGKKTGHTWEEIFALNKGILKNNPNKIYPGQELLIPDDHAALMKNPVVQARIRENLAKPQAQEFIR